MLMMLLFAFGTSWAEAQTKVEGGWLLTDKELIEVTARLENLVADSTLHIERAAVADSLYRVASGRATACTVVLAQTDTVLSLALRQRKKPFWEKIPDVVWFGAGVYVGSR